MLNFLHYILNQNKDSLLFRFFEAQLNNPTRGEWINNVRKILKLPNFNESFEEIKSMKMNYFMRIVKNHAKEAAFKYLLSKIKSKGKEIDYGRELKCQKYLLPNRILTWDEQVDIFSYRSRMNDLKYNFGGEDNCICGSILENEHMFKCEALTKGSQRNMEYKNIFNGSIKEQKYIVQILITNKKIFTLAQVSP